MAAKKRKTSTKRKSKPVAKENKLVREPEFMVNINDPKAIRKDILESLREVIIFMQGYEKFRAVQDEKTALFTQLKNDVKEINTLIDRKLRHFLPKGKLQAAKKIEKMREAKKKQQEVVQEDIEIEEMPRAPPRNTKPRVVQSKSLPSELDELESKLKEIEGQLEDIQ